MHFQVLGQEPCLGDPFSLTVTDYVLNNPKLARCAAVLVHLGAPSGSPLEVAWKMLGFGSARPWLKALGGCFKMKWEFRASARNRNGIRLGGRLHQQGWEE